MNSAPHPSYEYQDGGTLPPDSLAYVTRQADETFFQALKTGKFCYVLNSRQMGKSSLRVRAMQRLQEEGFACAAIDISINTNVSQEQWYVDLIDNLVSQFNLLESFDLDNWWSRHDLLSPIKRLSRFIEEVLLDYTSGNIIIFIDEIDSIISLNFDVDDFFAFIRYCHNQRADKPKYKRLTFVLLGVATPSDLIKDKARTPFNIGQAIELNGFEIDEVTPLAKGLEGKVDNPLDVLEQILYWTGGQPYLTHRLCKLVDESQLYIGIGKEAKLIKELVQTRIIDDWEYQDKQAHLQTIHNRILESESAGRLLGLYQKILKNGELIPDDSPEEMELRLSGLVVEQQNKLKVYNRIYQVVFDQTWVDKKLAKLRPYAEAINAWLASNHKDVSRLLRGKALEDAQNWATGKNLSNDDYQFLHASQAEAWKLLRFKFRDGEASNIPELINLCDKYPDEAEEYLFNEYLEKWLVAHLGRTDLGNISQNLLFRYGKEKRKGLEMFVRELCKSIDIEPFPKISAQPDKLNLGKLPVGYKETISIEIYNHGRGFAWGEVKIEGNIPGVIAEKLDFNSLNHKGIKIHLDTLDLPCGDYYGYIVICFDEFDENCRIPINFTVAKLMLYLEPKQLNLGVLQDDIVNLNNLIKLICEPPNGRIKGSAYVPLEHVILEPSKFETSSLNLSLKVDTKLMRPNWYENHIVIETNIGDYQIPISFNIPIRWENTFAYSIFWAFMIGVPMSLIRHISMPIFIKNISFHDFCYLKNSPINILHLIINTNNNYNLASWGFLFIIILLFTFIRRKFVIKILNLLNDTTIHFVILTIIALLVFVSIKGYTFIFLQIAGFTSIFVIDLVAYIFTLVGLNNLPIAWFIIGSLIGISSGILPTLNRTKKDNFNSYMITIIAVTIVLLGYLTTHLKPISC